MARKGTHQMGLVTMLIILVAIVAFVPWLLRILIRTVSGFEDSVPQVAASPVNYVPDQNTDYICRSPNSNGVPCPEGEFCDGTRQVCERKTVPSTESINGYFS